MITPAWHIEPDPSGFKVVYEGGPPEGGWNPQAGKSLNEILEELRAREQDQVRF